MNHSICIPEEYYLKIRIDKKSSDFSIGSVTDYEFLPKKWDWSVFIIMWWIGFGNTDKKTACNISTEAVFYQSACLNSENVLEYFITLISEKSVFNTCRI